MSAELWVAVASAVFGLISIGVAVWAVRTQRRPKQLDYTIVRSASLLAARAVGLPQPLTIEYGGVALQIPWLTTIRVTNTGKRAVSGTDYVEPISVLYDRNPPLQCALVAQSRNGLVPVDAPLWVPSDVPGLEDLPGGSVAVRPPLMNSGEWFELQLLSDGDPGEVSVAAVFPDQSRPMRSLRDRSETGLPAWTELVELAIPGIAIALAGAALLGPGLRDEGVWPYLGAGLLAFIALVSAALVARRR